MSFEKFSFNKKILAGITSAGYKNPTPIQEKAIPLILNGSDVLGLAQTGTGKTAAFVLPILQRLSRGPRGKLRALIISPTRELAEQTNTTIKALGEVTGLRSLAIYGGVGAQPQIKGLQAGAEIVTACPGRFLDLMNQKKVKLNGVEIVVLDEADQMFDMGFLPGIRKILSALPTPHQTLLFSATMPDDIRSMANEFLYKPKTIDLGVSRPVETVGHAVYPVEQTEKLNLLLSILDQSKNEKVLVFTRTKHRAKKLAWQLMKAGLPATSLQGNLSQSQRDTAMKQFRGSRVNILVATDIAARGIDVSRISHVINYDMPDTPVTYTHRIGRTGRMTKTGTALSFATQDDQTMLRKIENLLGNRIERRSLPGVE